MIYPLLPLFLTTVLGAGPAFLGIIEGVAESTASILKLLSGIVSDRMKGRKKLVLWGYSLSSLTRALVALAATPLAVLLVRFADRIGKGVRTSPRDALIADSSGNLPPAARRLGFTARWITPVPSSVPYSCPPACHGDHQPAHSFLAGGGVPGVAAVILIAAKVKDVERKRSTDGSLFLAPPRGKLRGPT